MSIDYETIAGEKVAVPTERQRHRFSLEEYMQMIEFGILGENDRVELIRGELVTKMPIGDAHASCVDRLIKFFHRLLNDAIVVRCQNPVVVLGSRPEPDVVITAAVDHGYSACAPQPEEILLLIEVADSSLSTDRTDKLSLYAEAGVREYWIADVNQKCVEVCRGPRPDGSYSERRVFNLGETLTVVALPEISLPVDQVFPARRDR